MYFILFLLLLSFFIFLVGIIGIIFIKTHLIIILISLELMILAVNLLLSIFSIYLNDILGIEFILIALTVAAAEVAVGLGIIVSFYRLKGSISVDLISLLKG